MNEDYSYGVLCEYDMGLDAFGNPIGEIVLLERVSGKPSQSKAIAKAQELKSSGRFGDVKVARVEVCNYSID